MIRRCLASAITTIVTSDLGRYLEVQPIGNTTEHLPEGRVFTFLTAQGKSVMGRVVDMEEEIQAGHFPTVTGIVVDTKVKNGEKVRRMQAGGVQGLIRNVPRTARPA